MPTSKELVANRPIAGSDLAKIMLRDLEILLNNDGLLSGHIAYGTVAYEIRYTMHMDNPMLPKSTQRLTSRKAPDNADPDAPETAITEFPLKEHSPKAAISSTERHRKIDSPNLARIETGLPVTVLGKDTEGHTQERQVKYPPEAVAGEDPQVEDRDTTREAYKDANISPPIPPKDSPKLDGCTCKKPKPDSNGFCEICGEEVAA
jgi:hypothetical protein